MSSKFETILVLDFGSQYTQLIARRLRELSVYSEILPPTTPVAEIARRKPTGVIFSGGPMSVSEAGAPLIVETLRKLDCGEIRPTPQDNSQATLAPILKKDDGKIDWQLSARKIYNRIRGLQPWPGAFTNFRGRKCQIWGKPLKPVAAGGEPGVILPTQEDGLLVICGGPVASVLRVEHIQVEGRNRVTDFEFMRGARIELGERFGA